MALFRTPELRSDEREVIELIARLRDDLGGRIAEPRRWSGSLRRMAFARAVQGSNSIEGYNASLDDVAAVVEDEATIEAGEETQKALAGYRDAMTYVLQVAGDPHFVVDAGVLKALHFMMMRDRLDKNPGVWRKGEIYVRNDDSGEVVYEGPDAELVPGLIDELIESATKGDYPDIDGEILVPAAMAHLNLVMIHPFSDGNGRMARCLQTLLLAREDIIAPIFSSIEEFLGRNTPAYYDVLAEVGRGSWNPRRDARPWLRFCLRAHYIQIQTVLRRRVEAEKLWLACQELAEDRGLPERVTAGMVAAAYGLRVRRSAYRSEVMESTGEEIADLTASRDLRSLVDAGLLEPIGERRTRYYVASDSVKAVRERIRVDRPPPAESDPFERARSGRQLKLPT